MNQAPTAADVIRHLMQLRATLMHALQKHNLDAMRFNNATSQVKALDEQLKNLGVDLTPSRDERPLTPTRAQRRMHKRRAGNTFTDRMNVRAQRAKFIDDDSELAQ